MRIPNPSYNPEKSPFPVLKFITVGKLKQILKDVDDKVLVNCQSIGNTGNLGLYQEYEPGKFDQIGIIDVGDEEIPTIVDAFRR